MGALIITGYTGERQITPAADAAVYRSLVGVDEYVFAMGGMLKGSMPSINQFTVMDGLASMQGRMIQVTQETLAVDTCATGYLRVDLVCLRYTHDNNSQIDDAELVVIKGTEVQSGNTPTPPAHNTGNIDDGATIVDMPLYKINLEGSTVTFDRLHERAYSADQLMPLEISAESISSLPHTITDDRILEEHICKPGDCYRSNPSAQTGEWTVTTADGSVTISGSISGTTSATLYLTIKR